MQQSINIRILIRGKKKASYKLTDSIMAFDEMKRANRKEAYLNMRGLIIWHEA